MKRIEDIDPNFALQTVDTTGMTFYDAREEPFAIYGLYQPRTEAVFRRMPEAVAKATSEGVFALHTHTAGGRIRFRTDSPRVILTCDRPGLCPMDHMPLTGTSCFDLYVDGRYQGAFRIKQGGENGYAAQLNILGDGLHDVLIHFPLYDRADHVIIGLTENAQLCPGGRYAVEKPVVFYGSSITQGGCASHGGNSYQAILSRRLDCDHVNLGFSGNAKGEDVMAHYIAELEMSAFVYDYDFNAPSRAHLAATHERMFRIIRDKQPELPILMVSKVAGQLYPEETAARRAIIRQTYEHAVASGDQNVYFLDGQEAFARVGAELCTVDTTHPNDLGFWCMANLMEDTLRRILGR